MKPAPALKAVEVEKDEVAGGVFDKEAEEGITPSKMKITVMLILKIYFTMQYYLSKSIR
jgi:hypothetical protein